MALALSVLDTITSSPSSTTIVSNSMTVATNDLVIVTGRSNSTTAPTTVASTTSAITFGSWTILSVYSGSSTGGVAFIAYAKCTAGGTDTLTVTWGGARSNKAICTYKATGYNSTPIAQNGSVTSTDATTAISFNLGSTPATSSILISAFTQSASTTITAGSGYTTDYDVAAGGGQRFQSQHSATSHNSTVNNSGNSASSTRAIIGVELAAGGLALSGTATGSTATGGSELGAKGAQGTAAGSTVTAGTATGAKGAKGTATGTATTGGTASGNPQLAGTVGGSTASTGIIAGTNPPAPAAPTGRPPMGLTVRRFIRRSPSGTGRISGTTTSSGTVTGTASIIDRLRLDDDELLGLI